MIASVNSWVNSSRWSKQVLRSIMLIPVQSLCEQVSWIRHRDIHILTVGAYTYTSDQRFQATHEKDTGDWTLQIKWVQKRDKGAYECQVSTQPVMSYFVNLEVVGKHIRWHG